MRKTDDNIILKMLQEGQTQKAIAKYFNVSPVAVHKRIRRLTSYPDTPNFEKLKPKEQKFCIQIAKGKTQTQAVVDSYEVTSRESAKAFGSQLMSKPEIKQSVEELMHFHGLTKSYRVQKLKTHIDNRDSNVSLKGLDMSFKLDGSYAPEKHTYEINYQDITRNLKEIEAEIARFEGRTIDAEFETVDNHESKEGNNGEN